MPKHSDHKQNQASDGCDLANLSCTGEPAAWRIHSQVLGFGYDAAMIEEYVSGGIYEEKNAAN